MRGSGTAVLLLGLPGFASLCLASSAGPLVGRTGAPALGTLPAEPTCNDVSCHSGNPLNFAGTLEIEGPSDYVPGASYPVVVRLTSTANQSSIVRRWGFELTAVSQADGLGAGSFSSPDLLIRTGEQRSGGRPYISHDGDTVQPGASSPVEWAFTWTAPPQDVGTVGFYAAGNAADGNLTNTGDTIYTTAATAPVKPSPVESATWGALKARFPTFPRFP